MRVGSSRPDGRITLRNWDSSNFPASIDFGAVEVAVEADKELRDLWRFVRSRVCAGKDAPIVLLRMLRSMINLEEVETSRATFGPRDKIVLFDIRDRTLQNVGSLRKLSRVKKSLAKSCAIIFK